MTPKISIIVPVYNTANDLAKCLDSCIQQSYADIEIIIVNDCSPDKSEEIILEYQKLDHRIKYIKNQQNKGSFASREIGTKQATGEYVLFVDSDDWIDTTLCEHLALPLQNAPNLVIFDTLSVRKEGIEKAIWTNKGNQNYHNNELFTALLDRSFSSWATAGKLFDKELALATFEALNIHDRLVLAEDLLFFAYYSFYAHHVIYVPCNGYYYNLTNNSINRTIYTLDKAQVHLSNLEIVALGLDQLIHKNNLAPTSFYQIKKELISGFLVQIADLTLEEQQILAVPMYKYFSIEILNLATNFSIFEQNVFRKNFDKIIGKIFKPSHWLYNTLRHLIVKSTR